MLGVIIRCSLSLKQPTPKPLQTKPLAHTHTYVPQLAHAPALAGVAEGAGVAVHGPLRDLALLRAQLRPGRVEVA